MASYDEDKGRSKRRLSALRSEWMAILFAQQFAHYSIAQLVTDLLILYPLATLLGGIVAARNRESPASLRPIGRRDRE